MIFMSTGLATRRDGTLRVCRTRAQSLPFADVGWGVPPPVPQRPCGLNLDDAAAAVGWKAPKLSRIENANAHIRPAEVTALLKAYAVTDPKVFSALEELAKDAGKRGWWQTYGGIVAPAYADYISLESDSDSIRIFAPLLVPGLMQTAAYARETIAGITMTRTPEEIAALAEIRLARQAVLTRPSGPLKVWAVISEAVLHQRFAVRPDTMRDQLRRLREVSTCPTSPCRSCLWTPPRTLAAPHGLQPGRLSGRNA